MRLQAEDGVRYTVPAAVCPDRIEDNLTVRFRVGDVYRDAFVSVYFDTERVMHRKKRVIAPGEMEQVMLTKELFDTHPDVSSVTLKIEKD